MRIDELLKNVGARNLFCDPAANIDRVVCDSRLAGPGAAFAAARRINDDGHIYIESAVKNGASLIVARSRVENAPCAVVDDGNLALAVMSANIQGRPADTLRPVGITGTKGKSTTAFMIKNAFEYAGEKCGIIGTVCNMAGNRRIRESRNTTPVPPELHALFREILDAGCRRAVMEVSSQALDVGRVMDVPFSCGVFTNLSQDHLDYHKTMDAYLRAKAMLFSQCGVGVVNIDDEASGFIMENTPCPKATFSAQGAPADFCASDIGHSDSGGAGFTVTHNGKKARVELSSPGRFMIYNALAAISCCAALGMELETAAAGVGATPPVPGRVQRVDAGQPFRAIVDYAHTPESIRQMTETAREFTAGRLISVFGCGGDRDRSKRPLMGKAAVLNSDVVIITTDNPRSEDPDDIISQILPGTRGSSCKVETVTDRRDAIRRALDIAGSGDTVLVMGKGQENYQEIKGVRVHFDDAEEIQNYLEGRF